MSLSYFNNNKWKRKQIYNDWVTEKEKKYFISRNKHGRNLIPLVSAWRRKKKEQEEWPWSWRNAVDEWKKGEPAFLGGKNAGVWFGGKNDLETLDWICFLFSCIMFCLFSVSVLVAVFFLLSILLNLFLLLFVHRILNQVICSIENGHHSLFFVALISMLSFN